MVGIETITDKQLQEWVATCAAGGDAYNCAVEELAFRSRHPEYSVA